MLVDGSPLHIGRDSKAKSHARNPKATKFVTSPQSIPRVAHPKITSIFGPLLIVNLGVISSGLDLPHSCCSKPAAAQNPRLTHPHFPPAAAHLERALVDLGPLLIGNIGQQLRALTGDLLLAARWPRASEVLLRGTGSVFRVQASAIQGVKPQPP